MTNETVNLHQQLMNEAYEGWRKQERVSYEDFVDGLGKKHRAAVILGNLNYQVENGGFMQWDFNGYSSQIKRLLRYLEEIGTPAAQEVAGLVQEFQEIKGNLRCEDDSYFDDEDEDEAIAYPYNHLDTRYYEINEQLMADVNYWLASFE